MAVHPVVAAVGGVHPEPRLDRLAGTDPGQRRHHPFVVVGVDVVADVGADPVFGGCPERRLDGWGHPLHPAAVEVQDDVDGVVGDDPVAHLGLGALPAERLPLDQQALLALAQVEDRRADDDGGDRRRENPGRLVAQAHRQEWQTGQTHQERQPAKDADQPQQRPPVGPFHQPRNRIAVRACHHRRRDEQQHTDGGRDALAGRLRHVHRRNGFEHMAHDGGDRRGEGRQQGQSPEPAGAAPVDPHQQHAGGQVQNRRRGSRGRPERLAGEMLGKHDDAEGGHHDGQGATQPDPGPVRAPRLDQDRQAEYGQAQRGPRCGLDVEQVDDGEEQHHCGGATAPSGQPGFFHRSLSPQTRTSRRARVRR